MAAACCSTALFSASRPNRRCRIVLPNSVGQPQLMSRFELSLRTARRLGTQKSASGLRVSCVGDTKAAVVTCKSWDKLVLESDIPAVVEFYASWCGPCRMVHRVIDEIAADYSGRIKFFVLDADKDLQVTEDYDVKAVPVVMLFKNGEKRDSVMGTMPKEFYVAAIERVLAS